LVEATVEADAQRSLSPITLSGMSAGQHADDLAAKAAEAVRRVVAEAEDRADEILREAEAKAQSIREQAKAEAGQIRERAEADARGQIEAAKRALDELGGTLVAAASEAIPKSQTPEPEPNSEPEPEPEEPAETPGEPEAPVSPPPSNGDDAAVRLVAMKLAVEGRDRAAIEAELAERFGAADRTPLLDEVLSRVAR
jgi:dsDNA-specific endonuclease/ATPase MutS2